MKNKFVAILVLFSSYNALASNASNFDEIAKEWAQTTANKYNTSVRYVDTIGDHEDTKHHRETHPLDFLKINSEPIIYGELKKTNETAVSVKSGEESIGEGLNHTINFERNISHKTANTIRIEQGFEIGMEQEIRLGFKGIADVAFTFNQKFHVNNMNEQYQEDERSEKVEHIITPESCSDKKDIILWKIVETQTEYEQDFTLPIKLSGCIAVWFNEKIDLNKEPDQQEDFHWLWFPDVTKVIKDTSKEKDYNITENGVIYNVRGKNSGIIGYDAKFQIDKD